MLSMKDKIEQFKRDCRSNDFYTKAILDCNERIEELDVYLTGLGCPNGNTGVKCENARDPYSPNKIGPMMEQWGVAKERDEYIRRINNTNSLLMKISDPVDRQIIVDLYIEKKKHENMADKYHYASRAAMYKHVESAIKKLFKEDTM